MIRQSLDARVNLCAGGGEEKEPNNRPEARTETYVRQGEETSDTKAEINAGLRA